LISNDAQLELLVLTLEYLNHT